MPKKEEPLEEIATRAKGWYIKNKEPCIKDKDIILKEIKTLTEYIEFICSLNTNKISPVFYRGQFNANYYLLPNVMRINLRYENTIIREFERRFPKECSEQKTTLERIALMQHFGLATRAFDISENPLVALTFACNRYPFIRNNSSSKYEDEKAWGEVALFRETNKSDWRHTPDIKNTSSYTTSIIANCALCDYEFQLGTLWNLFVQDGHSEQNKNYIKFRDIVSQSVIVRAPFANERQRNQRGAYILCNANELIPSNKINVGDAEKLTNKILTEDYEEFSFAEKENYDLVKDCNEYGFTFRKVKPYSLENKIEQFRNDPFNMKRLYYKNKEGKRYAVVIPPECKKTIARDLERFGLDNFFLYPEMYNVSEEINSMYSDASPDLAEYK